MNNSNRYSSNTCQLAFPSIVCGGGNTSFLACWRYPFSCQHILLVVPILAIFLDIRVVLPWYKNKSIRRFDTPPAFLYTSYLYAHTHFSTLKRMIVCVFCIVHSGKMKKRDIISAW